MKFQIPFSSYFEMKEATRDKVYQLIAQQEENENLGAPEIQAKLEKREAIGDLFIGSDVILPHFESKYLEQSRLTFIFPQDEENIWGEGKRKISLIIVLAFKPNEKKEIKEQIANFMRNLAEEEFVNQLLSAKSAQDIRWMLEMMDIAES